MGMAHSTRCLSSYLTTCVLTFRNPGGSDAQWLQTRERTDSFMIAVGKGLITHLACILLTATAAIEGHLHSVTWLLAKIPVETVLFIASFYTNLRAHPVMQGCLSFIEQESKRASSASFTLFWNILNLLRFNVCHTNVLTDESSARYLIPHLVTLPEVCIASVCIVIIAITALNLIIAPLALNSFFLFGLTGSYINGHYEASQEHQVYFAHLFLEPGTITPREIVARIATTRWQQIPPARADAHRIASSGIHFFQTHILDPIKASIRKDVLDADPNIMSFTPTRALYVYAFGDLKEAPLPDFFKPATNAIIKELRKRNYTPTQTAFLENKMQSLEAFNAKFSKDLSVERNLFSELTAAASEELQGGPFVSIWNAARQNYTDIMKLAQVRALYVYAFGDLKEAPLPDFFKAVTKATLQELKKRNYTPAQKAFLKEKMRSLTDFKEALLAKNELQTTLFTDLAAAALEEFEEESPSALLWDHASKSYLPPPANTGIEESASA